MRRSVIRLHRLSSLFHRYIMAGSIQAMPDEQDSPPTHRLIRGREFFRAGQPRHADFRLTRTPEIIPQITKNIERQAWRKLDVFTVSGLVLWSKTVEKPAIGGGGARCLIGEFIANLSPAQVPLGC
jgi:hypothetical protein